jgi:hypothetical protein
VDTVHKIRWDLLSEVISKFEKALGYQYVEVPWAVPARAIRSTFGGRIQPVLGSDLYAVGSGEQSFVELQLQGKLPPGRYITMTPCFREEMQHSDITRPHFMKAELYITEGITEDTPRELATMCMRMYRQMLMNEMRSDGISDRLIELKATKTDEGWDVMLDGVELGSYGMRTYEGVTWVYGTALAEPRFSVVVDRIRQPQK